MNYKKIYYELIEKAKLKNRKKGDGGYYEKHHIVPRCFGGDNKKENLILLTYREHFLAHLLLVQSYEGKEKSKMSFGLFQMCRKNSKQQRIISSKQFEKAKQIMSDNCSGENSSFYGKTHTDKVKSEISKRMKGSNNPSVKYGAWNKGLKTGCLSEEHCNKISESHIGKTHSNKTKNKISKLHKGKTKSKEHRKKISNSLKNRVLSKETKNKISKKNKGRKQELVTCSHCGKSGGISSMYRWHFDNCKMKKI